MTFGGDVPCDGERPHVLAERLGHRFRDARLLSEALTHGSVRGGGDIGRRSNERLEFLGDRVLGLVVAELLYECFPDEEEGALARRHSVLVSGETLARVAAGIGLGAHIGLSRAEAEAGGRRNPAILANACEAVIAAMYIDGGFDVARAVVRHLWHPLLKADLRPPKDAKTVLQEWAQARGRALPRYRVLSREGPDHAPLFAVEVTVDGLAPAQATGASKRAAESAAAALLLAGIPDGHGG